MNYYHTEVYIVHNDMEQLEEFIVLAEYEDQAKVLIKHTFGDKFLRFKQLKRTKPSQAYICMEEYGLTLLSINFSEIEKLENRIAYIKREKKSLFFYMGLMAIMLGIAISGIINMRNDYDKLQEQYDKQKQSSQIVYNSYKKLYNKYVEEK